MSRRILQLLVVPGAICETRTLRSSILALCDDGSLWTLRDQIDAPWERLPHIPQDGAE